ncbi:PLD nuclease N-terminal domain-containing protein [Actinacidiphila glaucinigra]|uniref:PLD nuclease N-terminal domain-containing protein n=1 Tax=Actinacidiphila glaucinigra TaxID=235986 RepID=UPI002DDA32FC|nr:PLD nuclease N-terminal domain-containing protein [Actinacidiphila glaucinigra]WSD63884.1 PLD nuclease N-terminal domain-containing protein [Actinacidiphila glaucinigra]
MTPVLECAIYLIVAALYVYAVVDCVRTPAARVRMLPKTGWLVIMALMPILGAIAWRNLGKRSLPVEGQSSTD